MSGSNHNQHNPREMYSNGYSGQYGQQSNYRKYGQYQSMLSSDRHPYYQRPNNSQHAPQEPQHHYTLPQSVDYSGQYTRRHSGETAYGLLTDALGGYIDQNGMQHSGSYGSDRRVHEGSYQPQMQIMGQNRQNYQTPQQQMMQSESYQAPKQTGYGIDGQFCAADSVPDPLLNSQSTSASSQYNQTSQNVQRAQYYETSGGYLTRIQPSASANDALIWQMKNGLFENANALSAVNARDNTAAIYYDQMSRNINSSQSATQENAQQYIYDLVHQQSNINNSGANQSTICQESLVNFGQNYQVLAAPVAKAPTSIISAFSNTNEQSTTARPLYQSATAAPSMPQSDVNASHISNLCTAWANQKYPSAELADVQSAKEETKAASVSTATTNSTKVNRTKPKKTTAAKPSPVAFPNSKKSTNPLVTVPKPANTPAAKTGPNSNDCTGKSPEVVTVAKRIEIPTQFPPHHCYRATAAYSLLRTLSKELRLSPFTLQSFLSALMLPLPSKLLGEVHVRVMRVLFANIGMGSYDKFGRGDGPIFLKRAKKNESKSDGEGASEVVEEFVHAKSCDNLYFLDHLTWPLFYEDYAMATEEKFVGEKNDMEEFIDGRSAAMVSDETEYGAHPISLQRKSQIPPYPGEGWIDRCPVGPFGHCNPTTGRFVCCPFHVHVALRNARQGPAATTNTTVPMPKKRKRSKIPKKKYHDSSSSDYSSNPSDSDSDEDFVSKPKKEPKGTGKRGRPRKYPRVNAAMSTPQIKTSTPNTNSIKGSRVMDVQVAQRIPAPGVTSPMHVSKVYDPKSTNPASSFRSVAQPPPPIYRTNTALSQPSVKTNAQCLSSCKKQPSIAERKPIVQRLQPVLVPPIPPQPVDLRAMAVSKDSEETITRFFLEGDLMKTAEGNDDAIANLVAKEDETKNLFAIKFSDQEEDLAHMAPIKQLNKGIPYHLLSLEMKLVILEFLLDEILSVDEIAKELTLRRQLTNQHAALYGELPHPSEFNDLVNEDECAICGLEGDLLCCDACPGSFHKQCIGMGPASKLPEGKWLCTECRVAEGSKMGPLRGESRPLIGWFSLNELEPSPPLTNLPHEINSSVSSLAQTQQYLLSNQHQLLQPQQSNIHQMTSSLQNADHPCQNVLNAISMNVEFLVTTGKVFARYRMSHEKFDPLKPTLTYSTSESLLSEKRRVMTSLQTPPEPLTNAQVMALLKLLGPEMCLQLPWCRLIFDPRKVFGTPAANNEQSPLKALILHNEEARKLLASHSDMVNPLEYDSKYRKAPPIPLVKQQLGQFVIPAFLPELFVIAPKIVSQFGCHLVDSLSLNSVLGSHKVGLTYHDVNQSLRDQMIKMAKQLFDTRMIDYHWDTLDIWCAGVKNAMSFSRLSSFLIKLADACSMRAFQSSWYQVKDNENACEAGRLTSTSNYLAIAECWTAEEELKLRCWQRCTKATVRTFLIRSDEKIKESLKNIGPTAKRGKRIKQSDVEITLTDTLEIDQEPRNMHQPTPTEAAATPVESNDIAPTESTGINSATYSSKAGVKNEISPSPATIEANKTMNECRVNPVEESLDVTPPRQENCATVESNKSTPNKSKSKKKRRTTRSLSPVPNPKKRCSERLSVIRRQIKDLLGIVVDESANEIDRKVHRLMLDELEGLLAEYHETNNFFFAIAGKKLFEPEGSVCPRTVKHLARNAGSVRAPFIAYETPFEVGESTTCHYWRAMALNVKTFEDLALSIKFFKEHIDQGALASSQSLVTRLSNPNPPVFPEIRCEHIDPMTGTKEYFIVNNKNQGKWQSEVNVDLPPYICYQIKKGKPYREEYNKAQKTKLETETKKRQEELKKVIEAKRAEEEKKTAEAQKRERERAAQNAKVRAEMQKRILEKMAKDEKAKAAVKPAGSNPITYPQHPQQSFEAVLKAHIEKTIRLLSQSAAKGEASVPVSEMIAARTSTMSQLYATNSLSRGVGGTFFSAEILKSKMSQAETAAVQQYTLHMKAIGRK